MALLLQNRTAPGVPVLLGSNRDEGTIYIGMNRTSNWVHVLPERSSLHEVKAWAQTNFPELWGSNAGELADMADELYFGPEALATARSAPWSSASEAWWAATRLVSDYVMWAPTLAAATHLARLGPTFVYYFEHVPMNEQAPKVPAWCPAYAAPQAQTEFQAQLGAFHCSEVRFIFHDRCQAQEAELQSGAGASLLSYWADFAEFGHPSGPRSKKRGSPHWPAFDPLLPAVGAAEHRGTLLLGTEVATRLRSSPRPVAVGTLPGNASVHGLGGGSDPLIAVMNFGHHGATPTAVFRAAHAAVFSVVNPLLTGLL